MRRNSDDEIRDLERAARLGDADAARKLQRLRDRTGGASVERRAYVSDLVMDLAQETGGDTWFSRKLIASAFRAVFKAAGIRDVSVTTDRHWTGGVTIAGKGGGNLAESQVREVMHLFDRREGIGLPIKFEIDPRESTLLIEDQDSKAILRVPDPVRAPVRSLQHGRDMEYSTLPFLSRMREGAQVPPGRPHFDKIEDEFDHEQVIERTRNAYASWFRALTGPFRVYNYPSLAERHWKTFKNALLKARNNPPEDDDMADNPTPDEERRRAERSGDPRDQIRAELERRRHGEEPSIQLPDEDERELGAQVDPQVAEEFFKLSDKAEWLDKVNGPKNANEAKFVIVNWLYAHGYRQDSLGKGWVHEKWQKKALIQARVVQFFRGGRGNWRKTVSVPIVRYGQKVYAKALAAAGRVTEAINIVKRQRKVRERSAKQTDRRHARELALRAGFVVFSTAVPAEVRAQAMLGSDQSIKEEISTLAHQALPAAEAALLDDKPGEVEEQIDSQLSVFEPPVFHEGLTSARRPLRGSLGKHGDFDVDGAMTGQPTSYSWEDGGVEITMRSGDFTHQAAVHIGWAGSFIGIDPISGGVSTTVSHGKEGQPGYLVGVIQRDDKYGLLARLHSLILNTPGGGEHLIRLWCRLISAYGIKSFVLAGARYEEREILENLASRGLVRAVNVRGTTTWVVSCGPITEDERQQLMFGRF